MGGTFLLVCFVYCFRVEGCWDGRSRISSGESRLTSLCVVGAGPICIHIIE